MTSPCWPGTCSRSPRRPGSAGPANSAADLRQACPAITIGQAVGSGHFIQLEVPDQVNAMIERFLTITDL
jgi:pimeloyl-ACP methyl ester carboxylesterase